MRRFALVIALLGVTAPAAAQNHDVSLESEGTQLEVHLGETWDSLRPACTTPCEVSLEEGHYHVGLSREGDPEPLRLDAIDVRQAITLQFEWVDRADLRLVGDVVLIAGVTIGALVGGTAFGGYQDGDTALLGLGITGLAVMGIALLVGIPLSLLGDSVQRVTF